MMNFVIQWSPAIDLGGHGVMGLRGNLIPHHAHLNCLPLQSSKEFPKLPFFPDFSFQSKGSVNPQINHGAGFFFAWEANIIRACHVLNCQPVIMVGWQTQYLMSI